jgi:alpha-N-arabinofuranosidase
LIFAIVTSITVNARTTVTGQIITSVKITDINTFEKKETIKPVVYKVAKKSGNDLEVDIPAKSVVMLEIK